MVSPIFFILTWIQICTAAAYESLFLVKLQNGQGWKNARQSCTFSMREINNFKDQTILNCLGNVDKSFTANVRLITEIIQYDGCLSLTGSRSNLMNDSVQMKNASVARCAYWCTTHSSISNFALQMDKCKCFYRNDILPIKTDHYNSHLCDKCYDSDGICGEDGAAAVYLIHRTTKLPSAMGHTLCLINKMYTREPISCSSDTNVSTVKGQCENGMNVSGLSWLNLMLTCIYNGSFLTDRNVHDFLSNRRRYEWLASEAYFPRNWFQEGNSHFSFACSFVTKRKGSGNILYNLNYTDSCLDKGRHNVIHYFCKKDDSEGNNDPNWKECDTSSIAPISTEDTTSKKTLHITDSFLYNTTYSSSGNVTIKSVYASLENTHTAVTTDVNTKILDTTMIYQTMSPETEAKTIDTDTLTTENPNKINMETEKTSTIVPATIGALSIVIIAVITTVVYCRRMSTKSQSEDCNGAPKANASWKDGELSVQLNVNISAETNNAPLYAVVSKPKSQSVGMNDKSGDDETKARGATVTDEYYVSNDEEYDRLGTKRKHNRTTSSDNEYDIADARTFDNNIYSLAKSIDADGHVNGAYDVALNVSAEMESAPGNDTYDHSSPL